MKATSPRMKPFWFRFCWLLMLILDWIPGYCRYYTIPTSLALEPGQPPRMGQFQRHWGWQRQAMWGFRLVDRLGMMSAWIDECERRDQEENPSSAP